MAKAKKRPTASHPTGGLPRDASPDEAEFSKATYAERRDERIAYYYFVRRITKPPAIYDFLRRECRECLEPCTGTVHEDSEVTHAFAPLVSANRASGLRTVQDVVMRLRLEAEPAEILKLRRPIETEKVRKTWEYLLQKQIEVIEDNSSVKVQKVAPSGEVVTLLEPRCSKQDKSRAARAALQLVEKIGKLTGAAFVPDPDDPDPAGESDGRQPKAQAVEPYTFSFPNVAGKPDDLTDMIAMNLDRGKVN